MSDEKFLDGYKLTVDAHAAGKLEALHSVESLLEELTQAVRDRIAAIESQREPEK